MVKIFSKKHGKEFKYECFEVMKEDLESICMKFGLDLDIDIIFTPLSLEQEMQYDEHIDSVYVKNNLDFLSSCLGKKVTKSMLKNKNDHVKLCYVKMDSSFIVLFHEIHHFLEPYQEPIKIDGIDLEEHFSLYLKEMARVLINEWFAESKAWHIYFECKEAGLEFRLKSSDDLREKSMEFIYEYLIEYSNNDTNLNIIPKKWDALHKFLNQLMCFFGQYKIRVKKNEDTDTLDKIWERLLNHLHSNPDIQQVESLIVSLRDYFLRIEDFELLSKERKEKILNEVWKIIQESEWVLSVIDC